MHLALDSVGRGEEKTIMNILPYFIEYSTGITVTIIHQPEQAAPKYIYFYILYVSCIHREKGNATLI